MTPTADPAVAPLGPRHDGPVTIPLTGRLDANAGVELLASLQSALDSGATRIDIDLLAVEDWTPEGARALRRCRSLARNLPDGLHYRTGPGAGHEALLDAFADDALDDAGGDTDGAGPGAGDGGPGTAG